MISLTASPAITSWLEEFLASGSQLSQRLSLRLKEPLLLSAVVPTGWRPHRAEELDVGGRGLSLETALEPARRIVIEHLESQSHACILVEDRYADREYPCGARGELPWIALPLDGHEELYWVCDRRRGVPHPDVVLGAVTGRRFLVVLSTWEGEPPEVCQDTEKEIIDNVADRATALVTEIFDGESFLIVRFGDGLTNSEAGD